MKKKITRSVLIILLMLPLIAVAHFFAFPEETRCILIRFADFEKTGNIYFRKSASVEKIKSLREIKTLAESRVSNFWGKNCLLDYDIIYCNNKKDFDRYGHAGAPAATQLKCGAYVVIGADGLDKDIIAHEISHTVLYDNIGWYKTKFKIPTWFDEGLAMQVDDRNYYSIDSLFLKNNNGLTLPDVMLLKRPQDFFAGTTETVMLNYTTAKFIVHEWLKTHSLLKFITAINNGEPFETAYRLKGE